VIVHSSGNGGGASGSRARRTAAQRAAPHVRSPAIATGEGSALLVATFCRCFAGQWPRAAVPHSPALVTHQLSDLRRRMSSEALPAAWLVPGDLGSSWSRKTDRGRRRGHSRRMTGTPWIAIGLVFARLVLIYSSEHKD